MMQVHLDGRFELDERLTNLVHRLLGGVVGGSHVLAQTCQELFGDGDHLVARVCDFSVLAYLD